MAKVKLYKDEEDETPKSFIPDNDEEEISVPKSFIPDEEEFKPAPLALKVDNPEVDRLLAEAKNTLSKTTDWSHPKEEELPIKQPKGKKGFLQGLKDLPESLYEQVSKTGKAASEHIKKGNYGEAAHDILSPVIDPFEGITKAATNLIQGKKPIEISPESAEEQAIDQAIGLLGVPGDRVKEAWNESDYPRLAGQGLAGIAGLYLGHKAGNLFEGSPKSIEEFPIRESVRNIPLPDYELKSTEKAYRRSEPTSLENFPAASEQSDLPISRARDIPPDLVPVGSEDIFNFARDGENLKSPEELAYDVARDKFNMGRDRNEIPPSEVPKSFIPDEEIKPTAKHIGTQEAYGEFPEEHLYNIEGGPKDKSTVTAATLREMGIEVPELNESLKGKTGAQLRDEALAVKEPKKFVNPFEKKTEESFDDILNNFGGAGHPDSPEYTSRVLSSVKNGEPGLSVESSDMGNATGLQHIVYRNPEGVPIAVAKVVQDFNGKNLIQDLAADKTKGLLTGRAMKAIGDKLVELGATESSGTISEDATNFLERMKGSKTSEVPKSFVVDDIVTAPEQSIPIDSPENIVEMHGGLGGFSPRSKKKVPFEGRYAVALDALFSAMGNISENRVKQDILNKTERARRFASFEDVKGDGRKGAAQSLGRLKGEFEKVDSDALKMGRKETDALFTAIKGANITTPEKARGYIALFKILNGETPQRNELRLLDDVFGNSFAERIVEMHGGLGDVGLKLSKTANTMKAMKSSLDLSAPLRQGIGLVHRPEYRSAFKEMFKYYGDKEYYNEAMQAIESDPDFLKARESGLFLSKHQDLTNSEEAFANNYIGNLPGISTAVDASERAYTGFLNTLRFQTFKNLLKNAEAMGHAPFEKKQLRDSKGSYILGEDGNVKTVEIPTKVAENIAKYINISTGRGGLGKLEKIAPELNAILWSPRLISSRLSILNPKYYMDMDTFTRREAIKSLFAIAASGLAVSGLGKYVAGAKVSTDVNSSDFMKARFGDNVLDPYAGFQQPVVAAARMITELNRMATGQKREFNKPSVFGIAGNFMANKLSPMSALAYEIGSAQKFNKDKPGEYTSRFGEKKNITPEIANAFIPMFIQDVTDVFKSDPSFAEQVGLDTASLFGMGVQQYPLPNSEKKSVFRKLSN